MTMNELLELIRPGKRKQIVWLALRPLGVSTREMVRTTGMVHVNFLHDLHMRGVADLMKFRLEGETRYKLSVTPTETPSQLHRARLRKAMSEAFADADDYDCGL